MKCLILVCFLAVCAANTERSSIETDRRIDFHTNGSVSLHGVNGNQFIISHYPAQNYYDIVINGIETVQKHLHIDSENCQITHLEGFTPIYQQYREKTVEQTKNHLFEILKKHEGKIDDEEYKDLLAKIEKAVENGKICHLIYHLLTKLDRVIEQNLIEEYVKHYHYQPEPKTTQDTIEQQQKLINLLLQYILTSKQDYPKYQPSPYQYPEYPYQYPQYPYQYQKQYPYQQYYPQQYQQYPYQYPQQYPYGSNYYGGEKSTYQNALQTGKSEQHGYGYGENQRLY